MERISLLDKMCQTESHLWVGDFDCEKSLQVVLKRRHTNKSVACQGKLTSCFFLFLIKK